MGVKNTDVLSLRELLAKVYYGLHMSSEGSKMNYIIDLIK